MEIVRYINIERVVPTAFQVGSPLRILQVVASPSDQQPLRVGQTLEPLNKEKRKIEGGQINVEVLPEPTYDLLDERLNEEPKLHVFHFDGHGLFKDGENLLYFESEESQADPINAELLQALISTNVSLVVLNACHSSKITAETNVANSFVMALLAEGIPAVVGMQFSPTSHLRRDTFLFVIPSFALNLVFASHRFRAKLGMTEKRHFWVSVLYPTLSPRQSFSLTYECLLDC